MTTSIQRELILWLQVLILFVHPSIKRVELIIEV